MKNKIIKDLNEKNELFSFYYYIIHEIQNYFSIVTTWSTLLGSIALLTISFYQQMNLEFENFWGDFDGDRLVTDRAPFFMRPTEQVRLLGHFCTRFVLAD